MQKNQAKMGGSRAEAVPPNKFKRFLTIASIAEMGLPYNQALNNAMLFYLLLYRFTMQ